jgi:hypothetical protein
MKTKEELQKYIREQISNPLIGQMIMDMTEEGVPYEDIMEMARKLIENTPKVEKEMVETQLRVQDGERILSTLTKEEEQKFDREFDYFNRKAEKYGFTTIWSISKVRALSLKSPFKGKWMTDGIRHDIKVELPNKRLTGIELWKYADKLYSLISEVEGGNDHIFIENFVQNGDVIETHFGS